MFFVTEKHNHPDSTCTLFQVLSGDWLLKGGVTPSMNTQPPNSLVTGEYNHMRDSSIEYDNNFLYYLERDAACLATLTLFACEPRDCADTTVELFGLRGTLAVAVAQGSPAWTVAVWEGRDWVIGTVHDYSSLHPSSYADAEPGSEQATHWADLVPKFSSLIVRDSLGVGDHIFALQDGAAAYHSLPPGGEPYQLVCAPCPPGVVCGPPVAYP